MPAETEQAFRISTVVAHGELPEEAVAFQPVHVEQLVFTLQGEVDPDRHAGAWQALVDRHAVLRTGVQSFDKTGDIDSSRRGSCRVSFRHEDWRDESDATVRAAKFDQLLAAERAAGFDPAVPPLLRVSMARWSDEHWRVAVTFGGRMLDWRSLSMLLREWLAAASGVEAATIPADHVTPAAGEQDHAAVTDAAFWLEYLGGYAESNAFELLADDVEERARNSMDARIVQVEQRLDRACSDRIRGLRKHVDVTLNNVAQAAWSILLSRYSGSNDVVFGIKRSCRRSAPLVAADAVGCFTNVIPFRARINEDESVLDLLWQVRDQYRKVRDHECTDMDRLRNRLRESGQELNFETVLDFDLRDPVAVLGELFAGTGAGEFRHLSAPGHDVLLQVFAEDEIVLRLLCTPAVMSERAAQRLLQQYAGLLAAIARDPQCPIADIEFLDAEESAAVCWPGAKRLSCSGSARSIHGGFEDRVRASPDAVAISFDGNSMTYAELNEAANRLAHRLREQGARPDMLIGLCVDRSLEQIIGMLGILKSGAGYLPLDPSYPDERLAFLVRDADVRIAVADDNGRHRIRGNERLEFVAPRVAADEQSGENPAPVGDADNLAYVIYTSGSTGQPKGVMVTHHNVVRLFDTCASWLQAGIGDVWTMFHSFAFDFSVWEIWGALLHGGRLEIVPRNIARSPEAFHQLLVERGVTVLNQTPSAFQQLMRVNAEEQQRLPALRLVIFGGEKLDLGSLRNWMRRHGDESPQLVNMYGITETTVHVTYRPITQRDVEEASSALIGWPLPDLYVRLLDERRRPVPPGTRGEICVGGAGVTRGYLNREDLNAQKFIRDPLSEDPAARLYCSGDFARLTANGELVYLGRNDDQLKIRGFRIDLGEISNTLQSIEGVSSAVVVPRDSAGGKRLVAYYVETAAGRMPATTLRATLARLLPEHMVPAFLVRLDEIPVNANNKIDYKALPEPVEDTGDEVAAAEMPATPAERALAEIWAEVLERRAVARTDDFFGLGGDSVLALQVIARARAAGMEISPRDLFENLQLSKLAEIATVDIVETARGEGERALTPAQHAFFVQDHACPQHYNHAHLFRLTPDTDVDLLEKACLEVVARHEALRSRYCSDERGVPQLEIVEPHEALEFSRIELDHLDDEECQEATALITADIQRSLSLSSGLLMRVAYFSGGTQSGDRLMIAIHKLAADAASWAIILHDLDAAYCRLTGKPTGELADSESPTAAPLVQASRWAAQLLENTESFAAEVPYWQQVIANTPDTPPLDTGRTGGRQIDARRHVVTLADDVDVFARAIHETYGTDVKELQIAALASACARQWPQGNRLRIDVEQHGRDISFGNIDPSRTVGWLSHAAPLLLDLRRGRTPDTLIPEVRQRLHEIPNKGIGWSVLKQQGRLDEPEQARRNTLVFRYLGEFEQTLNTSVLQHVLEESADAEARENRLVHPLVVTAAVVDGLLRIEFGYDGTRIDARSIEALAASMTDSLREITSHCRTAARAMRLASDFPLARLTQEELDHFPVDLRHVQDILPLSPIQRLYHTFSGTAHDVGFDQWVFRLHGRIDEAAFEAAWRELLRRHDALRTVFVDDGLAEPQQVVLREAPFQLQRSDWRLLDAAAQSARLEEFLAADRAEGFEMDVAPLTRVTLLRSREDEWILVWSHHMAQVDGWSWPILASELGELHDAQIAARDARLERPGSYRRYTEWLLQRDQAEYAAFWRRQLGTNSDSRCLLLRHGGSKAGFAQREAARETVTLPEALGTSIGELARELRLTPSTIFQGAWSLLLSALTARHDVTLGVAFSGRTAGIPLDGPTIGPFVNDLPVRVRVTPESRADQWLLEQRRLQNDINHFQNVSPREIHEWTGASAGRRLFDTLLVFQNYATGEAAQRWGRNIRVQRFEPGVVTNYPLALAVTPGYPYRMDFVYDATTVNRDVVADMANGMQAVLEMLARTPDVRLATVLEFVAERYAANFARNESAAARKVDDGAAGVRRPEQAANGATRPNAPGAPDGDARQTIAAVCREVLGSASLDMERNFFDAGAQSVSLIEIHDRLQKTLGRTFPIVKLFQHPTIAALARYLESGERATPASDIAGRRAAKRRTAQQHRRQPRTGRFDQP